MSEIDYDDAKAMADQLSEINNLPCTDGSGHTEERRRRAAMFEYLYARRDAMDAEPFRDQQAYNYVMAEIARLNVEEHRELNGEPQSWIDWFSNLILRNRKGS